MKPSIAFLVSRLNAGGGLEKYTLKLSSAFSQRGYPVTILTTGEIHKTYKGLNIVSLAKSSKCSFWHLYRYQKLCKKWLNAHPHQCIFGMERETLSTHYRAGSGVHRVFLKRRLLVDSYLKYITFYLNPLHLWILYHEKKTFEASHLKALFTNSTMIKNEILNCYNTQSPIYTIHNGVEWSELEKPFKESLSKENSSFHFLFIGNGYKRKGLDFLLRALIHLEGHWNLSVVGKEKNLLSYKRFCKENGLENKVHFYGPQASVISFYQKADALIIPSIYDPFANVTVEALAMGLYVISSSFNGGNEVINESNGTIVHDITNPKEFLYHLRKAFNYPKTLQSATHIRNSIKELDFSNQLSKIVELTLKDL